MPENDVTSTPVVEQSPIVDVVLDGDTPAPEADAQNSGKEDPAPADGQKTEESDEQKQVRRESRRSASNARKAAELAEAKTEARMLRERLDRLEKPAQATPEPKRENFDSLEAFIEARADYRATETAQKVINEERKARSQQETQVRTQEADKKVADAWTKGEEAFKKEAKDYDEVVGEFVESDLSDLDPTARRAILESDLGQRVLYHLAKNPEDAERIAKLSPTRQVIEIGKLEDKVVPQKKQSSAPAPVSKVKGASVLQGYHDNMTDIEYKNWRKANGARWAQ